MRSAMRSLKTGGAGPLFNPHLGEDKHTVLSHGTTLTFGVTPSSKWKKKVTCINAISVAPWQSLDVIQPNVYSMQLSHLVRHLGACLKMSLWWGPFLQGQQLVWGNRDPLGGRGSGVYKHGFLDQSRFIRSSSFWKLSYLTFWRLSFLVYKMGMTVPSSHSLCMDSVKQGCFKVPLQF